MNLSILLIFIFSSIVTIIVGLIVFLYSRNKRKEKYSLGNFVKNGKKTIDNVEYNHKYYRGSKNSPPYFEISINLNHQGKFKIQKENSFDRLAQKIGLIKKYQTRDEEFDNKFFITSDYKNFVEKIFSSYKIREAIKSNFKKGFTHLDYNGKKLKIQIKPFKLEKEMTDERVKAIVHSLILLKESIITTSFKPKNKTPILKRNILIGVSIFLAITGFILFIIGYSQYKVFDHGSLFFNSLKFSTPIYLFFLYIAYTKLKGRSSAHIELFIIAGISFMGFLFLGPGFLSTYNGAFDNSSPQSHETYVIKKYHQNSKNGKKYYAQVESWRETEFEKLRLSRSEYKTIEKGTRVEITTKAGALEYEWLIASKFLP